MKKKGQAGYIKNRKIQEFIYVLSFLLIGIIIFMTGYLWLKVRANVFTVLAILMAIPLAQHLVSFLIIFPYKSIETEQYNEIEKIRDGKDILWTDCIITSLDKVMSLDYIIITGKKVVCLMDNKKDNLLYTQEYLTKGIANYTSNYTVKVFKEYEDFKSEYEKCSEKEFDDELDIEERERVYNYLKSLFF